MSAGTDHLTAQVSTAAPQELHLMLIDGAIRFAQQAKQVWNDDAKRQAREEALTRCVRITGEMLASMRGSNIPAERQFTAVYAWLFRTMTEAKLLSDHHKLDDALELLAVERDIWQQVCERLTSHAEAGDAALEARGPMPVSRTTPATGPATTGGEQAGHPGLSLEA